jgi:hypothetical protein
MIILPTIGKKCSSIHAATVNRSITTITQIASLIFVIISQASFESGRPITKVKNDNSRNAQMHPITKGYVMHRYMNPKMTTIRNATSSMD